MTPRPDVDAPPRPPHRPDAAPTAHLDEIAVADDVRAVAPMLTGGRPLALAPVSGATWAGAGQLAVAAVVGLAAVVVLLTGVALGAGLAVVVLGLPVLALTLALARWYGVGERERLRAQLGVTVPAPAPAPDGLLRPRAWWAWLRDARSWAALAHGLVAWLLVWTAGPLAVGLAAGALVVPAVPFAERVSASHMALLVPAAVAALWLSALVVQLANLAYVRLARALLGGRSRAEAERAARAAEQRADVAEGRAEHLRETRTAAVVAADEERRRIERDLHDGAQQRLVALGVELGVARRAAAQDPAAAAAALEAAHGEVKEVLAELRDLVRGVHPAVLTDRGLDAALSALAARSPVPVDVEVTGVEAVGSPAQAAAYFVVAEALTNVAKHAGATRAAVRADVRDDRLRVEVSDDGAGGATAAPGGGLDGLRRRVEALDGSFDLVSPAGRGTVLTVEVPCAS
ncbi:integral membrane sensor signal transduction histidine kinase [Cellulomonas flavigena DSM 20109]|uniref:histidine kinase n=1 Tax=Cellulomonas flavigena (strain ATCC 482 / DSM 20109 / BCRC 11376 / JCM 18109 / NBRC 3775 / NCIMB 8073 / NRS 134) TaxID=446466 RepID=D5ULA4_CELFN|nr:sensor domain-containing protein [Cellulomonas flavigena]ADG75986.1 integral membrane sensor signal transduction histidine kinase [Cellulomonas flavigena DSM 20109]